MLFAPDRHETLAASAWDEGRARAAIADIVRDTLAQRDAGGHWRVHPQDDEGDEPSGGFKGLYLGRAGVWWALWTLQRAGLITLAVDAAAEVQDLDASYRAAPDTGQIEPGLMSGESGVLLAQWRLTGSTAAADRLHEVVAANIDHPANEAHIGAAGTMLAAAHLWRATGEDRWRALLLHNADALWSRWHFDEAAGCWLWTQDLYGKRAQYLGAVHGFAGNVCALLKASELLDPARREQLVERSLLTLRRLARWHDGAANWPPGLWTPRPGVPPLFMQWCHGAPGVLTSFAGIPPGRWPELDALLLAAGEAVWRAGPLVKGPGLCHGTSGNALSLLTLFERSGDALWLERARAFAMHAATQCEAARDHHGRGRPTLLTGDLGVALALRSCVEARAGWPLLDLMD
jgi:hypothetical protein